MFFFNISGTNGPSFINFEYVFHQYHRNPWTDFHDFWICFSLIFKEPMDQFSWFLNMFFFNISGTNGPSFIIFEYVFHQYHRNPWTNFHDFWICFSSLSPEPMDQFSWFLNMFFIDIFGTNGPIFVIFEYVFLQYLRN